MSSSRTKVLLVEDSKSFAALLEEVITSTHGFEVDRAENLAETREILAAHPEEYFAAIVDFHLPDAPNGEAIDVVVNAKIPTMVFTGSANKSMKEDLWQKRIADYANKSGSHNIEYVVWMVKRLHSNQSVELLVVDDSLTARRAVCNLLKRQNFVVHSAKSGKEALELLQEHPQVLIAVVDCNMEGMDGLELTSKIRENHPRAEMEVVGISSQSERNLAAKFIKCGASDFVTKPLIPEEFLCRINNAVDRIDAYINLDKLNQLKNQFLGTAAHDIRGPLGSIKTAADFLLKRSPSPERTEALLNIISNSSIGLLDLLETLLDISVIESGVPKLNKESVDVSAALSERLELYQSEATSKGITLQRQNIAPELMATVDPLKIKQVFDNLITNAIKYSNPNTEVDISLCNEGSEVRLSVRDAGPGIPQEEQSHLFKAFSVLSSKATGGEKKTGLGLAIAKNIVEAHDGRISYQHNASCHSTFTVALPI